MYGISPHYRFQRNMTWVLLTEEESITPLYENITLSLNFTTITGSHVCEPKLVFRKSTRKK